MKNLKEIFNDPHNKIHTNGNLALAKRIADKSKYGSARFIWTKKDRLIVGDANNFIHANLRKEISSDDAAKLEGYVDRTIDNYKYKAYYGKSNNRYQGPELEKFHKAGIVPWEKGYAVQESFSQSRIHRNPSPEAIKNITKNSEEQQSRFVIKKYGDIIIGDAQKFIHHDFGPRDENKTEGYIYHNNGKFTYQAFLPRGLKKYSGPELERFHSYGITRYNEPMGSKQPFVTFKEFLVEFHKFGFVQESKLTDEIIPNASIAQMKAMSKISSHKVARFIIGKDTGQYHAGSGDKFTHSRLGSVELPRAYGYIIHQDKDQTKPEYTYKLRNSYTKRTPKNLMDVKRLKSYGIEENPKNWAQIDFWPPKAWHGAFKESFDKVYHNTSVPVIKNIIDNSDSKEVRFVIDRNNKLHAGDASLYLHTGIAGEKHPWIRGIAKKKDNKYTYIAKQYDSPVEKGKQSDHPLLQKFHQYGIVSPYS